MQTFLPYENYYDSADSLDRARQGKQRSEAKQALNVCIKIITGSTRKPNGRNIGWLNHPCRIMWTGYEYALANYGIAVCDAWIARGYKDTCREWFLEQQKRFQDTGNPPWLGSPEFHRRHKLALIRKGYEKFIEKGDRRILDHYCGLWPELPIPNIPASELYIWPQADSELSDVQELLIQSV